MLNSLQNGRCYLIFITLLLHTTIPTISVLLLQSIFTSLFRPYLLKKSFLQYLTNTPFLYTTAIFHLPIFVYNHPNNIHQKYFPYFSYLANSGCFKRLRQYFEGVNLNPGYALDFSLRGKCPYSELFWSTFCRIWTECGLNVFSPNAGKCGPE